MATVTVRFWAGAQRAAGHEFETLDASSIDDLRDTLAVRPDLARVCERAAFLIDGEQASTDAVLRDGQTVDVLPPFAGGER
jgi:molybdopterin converting factor small subunit